MAQTKKENKASINPQSHQEVEAYRFGYNKGFEDGSAWAEDRFGWHPASALPPLKTIGKPHTEPRQYKESDYIIFVTKNGLTLIGKYGEYPYKENVTCTWGTDYNKKFNGDNKGLCFEHEEILCWCDLPKEIKE